MKNKENLEILEDKYIDLLLKRCIDLKNNPSLLINFIPENEEFVKKVEKRAYELGASNVILDREDPIIYRDELSKTDLNDIENKKIFRRDSWNENANNNGSFIFFKSLEPNYLLGIDEEKIKRANYTRLSTKKIYNQKRDSGKCSWCIASLPNQYWADQMFPGDPLAYEKLYSLIFKMCMVDCDNPIKAWDDYLIRSNNIAETLNDLKIKSMYFKNSLGTDLTIYLPEKYRFCCAYMKDHYGVPVIVNMPSYEVFTSPTYNKTDGIVYSSKPLYYNNQVVESFWLRFKDGKVVDMGAKQGLEVLKSIVEMEDSAKYLGEVALVNDNSPISNTNMVFMETLFDENASCHLALGSGFPKAIDADDCFNQEKAFKYGVNKSNIHVDFMFGTNDLEVEVTTRDNQKIKVFNHGNFIL